MEWNKMHSAAEAILFSCADAVGSDEIGRALNISKDDAIKLLLELQKLYDEEKRGFKIIQLENKFQMCSREDYFGYIRAVTEPRRQKGLSQAALETLSIIAYNQPITRSRIEFIRGVDCTASIASLCERGLIDEAGRLDAPGKPILYKTTDEFLRCFGLSGLDELPEIPNDLYQGNFLENNEE